MRVTRTLRNQCGASVSCDKIHDTDDPKDVIVQGRTVDPTLAKELGVPEGEGLLAVERTVIPEVGGATMMNVDQLVDLLEERHHHDLFRLETLDHYAADSDASEFAQYQRGEPRPDLGGKAGWLDSLRADHAAGRNWRVVHVIRQPLTDYLRYELEWCYVPNMAAGQDIRILDLTETGLPAALVNVGDFFVVDHDTVIRMHYDRSGDLLGAEIVNQAPATYVALRDLIWNAAEPFPAWWSRHPEFHRARRAA